MSDLPSSLRREQAFIQERMIGTLDAETQSRSLEEEQTLAGEPSTDQGQRMAAMANGYRQAVRTLHEKRRAHARAREHVGFTRAAIAPPPANNWIPIGPAGLAKGQADTMPIVSGRTRVVCPLPGGTRIYIATANGGVWRSEDSGQTWRSVMDNFDENPQRGFADSQACGAMVVAPGSSPEADVIFVGTGEGYWSVSGGGTGFTSTSYRGLGPVVSENGGRSWRPDRIVPANGLDGQGFYEMALDPNDPHRVVAASTRGIYRREGNLATGRWRQRGPVGIMSSVVVASKNGQTTFYAARAWASFGDNCIYTSNDGEHWTDLGELPTGRNERKGLVSLAVHPHEPDVLYALIALANVPNPLPSRYVGTFTDRTGNLHGLYRMDRSSDGDGKWHWVQGIPNTLFGNNPANRDGQGNYDICLAIAPDNLNRVYVGGKSTWTGSEWGAAIYRCEIVVNRNANGIANVTASSTFIGDNVHADVHSLAFTPNEPDKLWVGCDGGVFFTNRASRGSRQIFQSKNVGLQTLTMNHMDLHPTDESIIYCGSQDNGGIRYTNDELWTMSSLGDGGYFVVNWNNPDHILSTYTNADINRSTNGGERGSYSSVAINLANNVGPANNQGEDVLWYAPLVGTPASLRGSGDEAAKADIVAFGSERPWISTSFGGGWRSIPTGNYSSDRIKNVAGPTASGYHPSTLIRSMVFASDTKLYVGTMDGQVYKYEAADRTWNAAGITKTRLDNQGTNRLNAHIGSRPITDIIIHPDPAHNGDQVYVSIGGIAGPVERVWRYDDTTWIPLHGPAHAGLLYIQHNALAAYMEGSDVHLFAAADVGIWHSPNGGMAWNEYSHALPDSAVVDLKIFHRTNPTPLRLLRASTFGRGMYERTIPDTNKERVELYLRDTVRDQGRYPTELGGDSVASPDIKVDAPDAAGNYQFSPDRPYPLSFGEFLDELTDRSQDIFTHASERMRAKVYVLVHNRGIEAANNVRVYLLRAISGDPPPSMPATFVEHVARGQLIADANWETIGIQYIHDVRPGTPQVASFDFYSDQMPPTASLPADEDIFLMALVHHAEDNFTANNTDVDPGAADNFLLTNRKATFKKAVVKTYAGLPPSFAARIPLSGYVGIPATATAAEAPFDPFLAAAFQLNDNLFNRVFAAALTSPLMGNRSEALVINPEPFQLTQAATIMVDSAIDVPAKTPLIWFARERIVINQTINARGRGAQLQERGDFGGSGGGGATAGQACELPRSGMVILPGGGAGGAGNPATIDWASRALLMLPMLTGGAAGGDASGGRGGGVIVLCAPTIELQSMGILDARGDDGTGTGGGGGGGLVVLIAREMVNVRTGGANAGGANANVLVAGGAGPAGAGGHGLVIENRIS